MPEPITSTCEQCGQPFEWIHPSAKRRFCSRSCVAKWSHQNGRISGRVRTGKYVDCETCGENFYAKKFDLDKGWGRFCSFECKVAWSSRDSIVRPCGWCGEPMKMGPFRATIQKYCSTACSFEGKRTAALDREHNGRRVSQNPAGYIMVWEPENPASKPYDGWMWEHRYVMETVLGRPLEATETVHHINGVKDDNRAENLTVLSRAEHTKVTNKEGMARRKRERLELAEYRRRFGELEGEPS